MECPITINNPPVLMKNEVQQMDTVKEVSIEHLPEEVLEFILSFVSPYKDLHDCMQVSKKWRRCVQNVTKCKQRNLKKAINDFDIQWSIVKPADMAPTVTKRYSHTAVVVDNSMYIFGGCTCASTTFNDLWRLDLSKRQWIRPLTMGTYPSPKACSSLVKYKNTLVLFGGWTYPPTYPLYQSWHLFNELHVYDIVANKWTCVTTVNTPPPVAGHSASIIGEWMIVFGGLQKPSTAVHCDKTNEVWKLNLETWTWHKQEIEASPIKPSGRFGQTQVILDPNNLLILGGSGGPLVQYDSECWILNMCGPQWRWIRVEVVGRDNQPTNIWSNPGCKIGDKIVVLNKIKKLDTPIVYYPRSEWNQSVAEPKDGRLSRIDLAQRKPDVDENVNGKRGYLKNLKRNIDNEDSAVPGPSNRSRSRDELRLNQQPRHHLNMAAFNNSEPEFPNSKKASTSEKRLAMLSKVEKRLTKTTTSVKEKKAHYMGMYVLDISRSLEKQPLVRWLPPKNLHHGPEETMLYTLAEGKSELIMFGGIQKDANTLESQNMSSQSQISNSLHFITAPKYVI